MIERGAVAPKNEEDVPTGIYEQRGTKPGTLENGSKLSGREPT